MASKKFLVSIALTVGSAAAPALTLGADAATGLYQIGTSNIGLAVAGVHALNVDTGGLSLAKSLTIGTGGNYTTGSIYSDANWGMVFRAKQASPVQADYMWAKSDGTEVMRIAAGALKVGSLLVNMPAAMPNGGTTQIGYTAVVIAPSLSNVAQMNVASYSAYSASPSFQVFSMTHYGSSIAGNLDYCPSVVKANTAELIAVNSTGLVITTNTGFVAIGAAALERARFAADGTITLGGLSTAPAVTITPSATQTRSLTILGGNASTYVTLGVTGAQVLRIGAKGSAPELVLGAMDGTNEGGQFTLEGAASNLQISFDNYAGALRIMNTGVAGSELFVIGTTGNSTLGNATGRDGLLYLDVKNVYTTGGSTGAIIRLISRNAANTGDVAANIVKYRSGSFYIGNDETDTTNGVLHLGTAGAVQVQVKVKASADRVLTLVGGKAADGSIATVGTSAGSLGFGPSISIFAMDLVNRVQIQGAASGSPVYMYAVGDGTDANIGLYLGSKGTGSIYFATNGAATTQLEVHHTANADRIIKITGGESGVAGVATITTSGGALKLTSATSAIWFAGEAIAIENFFTSGNGWSTGTAAAPRLGYRMGNDSIGIYYCTGAPTQTGLPAGSICIRKDGGVNSRLYSTDGTSWYAMTSA